MKKLKNYYFALMAIASLSFLTSCGGDDEPNPKPTIGLTPSATDITAAPGEKLNVNVQVTSADKLKEFKVMKGSTGVSQEVTKVTSFPSSGHEYLLNDEIPTSATEGTKITYTITATTNKDEIAERTITVTVRSIETFTAKIMGNQNSSVGSFFSTTDGMVRNTADAKANSALIDLVFYHSSPASTDVVAATNAATIASPTDPKAEQISTATSPTSGLTTWTTQNNTELKLIGSGNAAVTAFNAIANGPQIATAYMNSTATGGTFVNKLKADDVFGFMTANGKHGVARVISLNTNTTPSFTSELRLDIKVQR